MNVVADTNVLVSALFWQGPSKHVLLLARDQKITLCVNKELIEEFERVLGYAKFRRQVAVFQKTPREIVNEFLEVVAQYPSLALDHVFITDDPSDDAVLACAVASRASCIVSGDHHLLALKRFRGIPIVTPRQFLQNLNLK